MHFLRPASLLWTSLVRRLKRTRWSTDSIPYIANRTCTKCGLPVHVQKQFQRGQGTREKFSSRTSSCHYIISTEVFPIPKLVRFYYQQLSHAMRIWNHTIVIHCRHSYSLNAIEDFVGPFSWKCQEIRENYSPRCESIRFVPGPQRLNGATLFRLSFRFWGISVWTMRNPKLWGREPPEIDCACDYASTSFDFFGHFFTSDETSQPFTCYFLRERGRRFDFPSSMFCHHKAKEWWPRDSRILSIKIMAGQSDITV